jgi:predicted nucleotidyltransferase
MLQKWVFNVNYVVISWYRSGFTGRACSVPATMNPPPARIFSTIPRRDYLDFFPNGSFEPQRVVRFLALAKVDVARIAEVPLASVRFDRKIPASVLDRLVQIATVCGLVAQFFEGDRAQTSLWFKTQNPMLGQLSPRDMIRQGRIDRLRRFVLHALAAEPTQHPPHSTGAHALQSAANSADRGEFHPLIRVHRQAIEALCQQHGVRSLALFGSILRADFDPTSSDIDLAVEFTPQAAESPAHQYFDFKSALEQLLGRPVDLVELSVMPETRLRRIIERTQRQLYAEAA